MTKLASNRSARWAFMERFDVPDYDDPSRNYLTRWRLVQTPLFGIYLHRFDGPDPRATLHDHPWSFVSLVLRGGYIERRLDPVSLDVLHPVTVTGVNRKRLGEAHSISRLLRVPTWTLMLVGRRVRTWGYLDPVIGTRHIDGRGQFEWTAFDRHPHAAEFDQALLDRAELSEQAAS